MPHHRYRLALASLATLTLALPVGLSDTPAFADCSQADRNAGECRSIDGSTGDNSVTIRVDVTTPGSSGSGGQSSTTGGNSSGGSGGQGGSSGGGGGGGGSTGGGTSTDSTTQTPPQPPIRRGPPPPPRNPTLGSSNCEVVIAGMCRGASPPRHQPSTEAADGSTGPSTGPSTGAQTPATPPTPPSSISELGAFSPERPGLAIQPGDWSMPRLHTNVIANARTHRQSGELAGWPIEVRFIPYRYHWSFGDGNHATFSEPGRTWEALGRRQFDPTPTSHVYERPGTYEARVRVEYRAEFRFVGESWQRLSGTVSNTSQTTRIRVLTVSPLLLGD
jgi:hypothetical protein